MPSLFRLIVALGIIGGVVYGHWLLVSVTYRNGQLSGVDALDIITWGRWVTWLFQVMPVVFLVGGYVNAQSWMAHHAAGETWTQWVRDRVLRLLWPTAVFLVVGELAVMVARAAGAPTGEVAEAGWLAAIQLWFRAQAKRSQFRRRQTSSRIATFAEAFVSIAWAASAALAAGGTWFAVAPAVFALVVLAGARWMSPRKS